MQSVSLAVPHFEQEETYSCVAACVRMVLEYYSFIVSEDEVRRQIKTKPGGTPFVNVAQTVPWWDINLELGEFNFPQLNTFITSRIPPIVFLRTEPLDYWTDFDVPHAVVLTAIDTNARTVEVNDPFFTTPQQTSIDSLNAAWFGPGNLAAILRLR